MTRSTHLKTVEFAQTLREGGVLAPATRCALALVQAHGLTDLRSPQRVLPYALAVWPPLPGIAVTGAFFAASIVHIARDAGIVGSIALHAAIAALYWQCGQEAAFYAMLAHLACVHAPLHYAAVLREATRASHASVGLALALTPVFAHMMQRAPHVTVSHTAQRIVLAHVVSVHACTNLSRAALASHAT